MKMDILFTVDNLTFLNRGPYSFQIMEHEILGMTGDSGIGKTQMLRALVELIVYDGEVRLQGVSSSVYAAPEWRRKVALVPADSVWWYDTVAQHFDGFDQILNNNDWLLRLGFDRDVLHWRVSRLSSGERQRLALARALVYEPSVVLLDEPCAALDEHSTRKVEEILLEYNNRDDTGLILVSHDLDQLYRLASRCFRVSHSGLEMMFDADEPDGNNFDKVL